ncbi:MAG TPA: thymidine phosphorylase [Pyrinomonadaceae bacterium]|nr:thymidine phosphorylase [Pyrinomonadaceae bacterium]
MRPQEIIEKKRDGLELSSDEIAEFIRGVCDKTWADYQIATLLMAMYIRGLTDSEGEVLTREMLYSGDVLDFSDIEMPKADKHSTGGVGDKTSLLIAPIVAACGVAVPMISGRGLGHTGGTLDKLESIAGYNVNLSTDEFRKIVKSCGFAMTGQTDQIAPADKKIYALRDATATVPYIPLIVASIMSKKLAEGLDALVLDVKTGSGAFMQSLEDSKTLSRALVETGVKFGIKAEAVVSDMNQPLGQFVGNAHEIYECIKILRGEADERAGSTAELSFELSARMLLLSGVADSIESARASVESKISNGEALERFRKNVGCQGGDQAVCDDPEKLFDPKIQKHEIKASRSGFVGAIDTLALGNALSEIGGGRVRAEDEIDNAVGYECVALLGERVAAGAPIGILFCRSEAHLESAGRKIADAYDIQENAPSETPPLIHEIISP